MRMNCGVRMRRLSVHKDSATAVMSPGGGAHVCSQPSGIGRVSTVPGDRGGMGEGPRRSGPIGISCASADAEEDAKNGTGKDSDAQCSA